MNTVILSQKEKQTLNEWHVKLSLGSAGGYFQLLPKEEKETFRLLANKLSEAEHYSANCCCGELIEAVEVCYDNICKCEYLPIDCQQLKICGDCLEDKREIDNF